MSAVFSGYFKAILKLQSSQVRRTLIDIINESIIWKMNPLVVDGTSIKFKSPFLHAKWANNFYDNFSVFGQIEKSLSG